MSRISRGNLPCLPRDELIKRAEILFNDCNEYHRSYKMYLDINTANSIHCSGMYRVLFNYAIHELEEVLEAIAMVDGIRKEWSDYVTAAAFFPLVFIDSWGEKQAIVKSKLEELKHLPTTIIF